MLISQARFRLETELDIKEMQQVCAPSRVGSQTSQVIIYFDRFPSHSKPLDFDLRECPNARRFDLEVKKKQLVIIIGRIDIRYVSIIHVSCRSCSSPVRLSCRSLFVFADFLDIYKRYQDRIHDLLTSRQYLKSSWVSLPDDSPTLATELGNRRFRPIIEDELRALIGQWLETPSQ